MKTIAESILDTSADDLNSKVAKNIKIINGVTDHNKTMIPGSQFSNHGKDMFGNTIKVGDVVITINYYENFVYVGIVTKIFGSGYELSLGNVAVDDWLREFDSETFDIDGTTVTCQVDSWQVIKIHNPEKFLKTHKL